MGCYLMLAPSDCPQGIQAQSLTLSMQPRPPCPAPAHWWWKRVSGLLLHWELQLGTYSVGFFFLFPLHVILPSEIPNLLIDPLVRGFLAVWKFLILHDSLLRTGLCPKLFCLSFCLLYFVLPPLEENGLPFWVPGVLCQCSEVVLWKFCSAFE